MEAARSSETSVGFHQVTRRYIPEDRTRHSHLCESLRSLLTYRVLSISLIDAGKEIGLEVNKEKRVYIDVWSPECRAES
jgi:hypothetical protein